MWTLLWATAALARPVVALEVVDPGGATVFEGEVEVGSDQRFEFTDDARTWRLLLRSSFQKAGVALEGRLEELKGRSITPRAQATVAPEAETAEVLELGWKRLDGTWKVRTTWAHSWSAPPAGPLPDGKSRFVVVWDDAELRVDPREPGGAVRLRELPEGRTNAATQTSPYKLVHTFGDGLIEIESIPEERALHCADGAPPASPRPESRYVSDHEALFVTTRAVSASFEDGSGYTVAAGVVVAPRGGDLYEAQVGELRLPIRISAPDDVGTRYRPTSHFPVSEGPVQLLPVDGVLGELPLGPVRWTGDTPPTIQARAGVKAPLVTVRHPCAEVHLRTTAERLRRVGP